MYEPADCSTINSFSQLFNIHWCSHFPYSSSESLQIVSPTRSTISVSSRFLFQTRLHFTPLPRNEHYRLCGRPKPAPLVSWPPFVTTAMRVWPPRWLIVPLTALGSCLECPNYYNLLLLTLWLVFCGVSFLRTETVFWASLLLKTVPSKDYANVEIIT